MPDRKRMTLKEAEHILLNINDYVIPDNDSGFFLTSSLVDATLLAIKAMRAQAAEETTPVVHAKWMELGNLDDDDWCWMCSNCRQIYYDYPERDRYCPNCGAKMDGGND